MALRTVSCGATQTGAVAEDGRLFLWGFGESLHPKSYPNIVNIPRLVQMPKTATGGTDGKKRPVKVADIALGQAHALILTRAGDVYTLGSASMGQVRVRISARLATHMRCRY